MASTPAPKNITTRSFFRYPLSESDLSPLDRAPNNCWSNIQKTALVLLVENYHINWKNIWRVFNHVFARVIPSARGLTEAALRSSYRKVRLGKYQIEGDQTILRADATEMLERSMQDLRLPCKRLTTHRAQHDGEIAMSPGSHINVQDIGIPHQALKSSLLDSCNINFTFVHDSMAIPAQDSMNLSNSKAHLPILKPRILTADQGPGSELGNSSARLDSERIPLLGFRAYSANSQGRNGKEGFSAGLFHAGGYMCQPHPSSTTNRELVLRHVKRRNRNSSPFIRYHFKAWSCQESPDANIDVYIV